MNNPSSILSSNMPLNDWRGSFTTLNGFTGTRPAQEFENLPWGKFCELVCSAKPFVVADKRLAQYFLPCLLKVAPLVGNTLEAAKKAGESTIGKMRSKNHVTEAAMLIMDIDGLNESDFIVGLDKISNDGITFLAYTTHSHGSPDKSGVRARLVIPLDHPLATGEYYLAWHGLDKYFWNGLAGKADSSGANLYQQQGIWSCHPSRIEHANRWVNSDGGVVSAQTLIELGRSVKTAQSATINLPIIVNDANSVSSNQYPPSDANKVAERCNQIREFRDKKGAGQNETL
ncbi:MAG: hypothetical protein KGN35_12930, partial [Betaproteobacteria bacterium]|nr:hypothetical protein [Betaproteobacteria bacterium]